MLALTHLSGFGIGADGLVFADQPLLNAADKDTGITVSGSDLVATSAAFDTGSIRSVGSVAAGKRYVEAIASDTNGGVANWRFGVGTSATTITVAAGASASAFCYQGNGNIINNNSSVAHGTALSTNDVLMMAVDLDTGDIWFGRNGTWIGDPAAGTSPAYTMSVTTRYLIWGVESAAAMSVTLPLLADYAYPPPSGFSVGW